ncbi:glycoside hydrolase family 9 protein [Simiduia curdlanivorans]|uniref:Endoglucanase n=1 Tax=Simiduia curdlanivorans TaxID=1492769 RepID=A0ABV8V0B9_9GAMM|nr:glycoside hydrolase family 9 protein [Simiduia curdlanivorans]MDN3637878.1 glycoside hydrolase family 9 protein [Simiduia curdlanivorans]
MTRAIANDAFVDRAIFTRKCTCCWPLLVAMGALMLLQACGGSGSTRAADNQAPALEVPSTPAPPAQLFVNQVGYKSTGDKPVWIKQTVAQNYQLLDQDAAVIATGSTTAPLRWAPAEQALTRLALPKLTQEGHYTLRLDDGAEADLLVANTPWAELHHAALRSYYLNRSGMEILSEFAGPYARALGHADLAVKIHRSAATGARPEGSIISAGKGWYDAGDYNKYVVNSGISTYTLLLSYQHFSAFYQTLDINIPESAAALPDILAEIKWNLDWLQAMQDPSDGGVYHKLTSLGFNPMEMPARDNDERYVVQKSTAAALNFAALMAAAARVYRDFDAALAGAYEAQAIAAFGWAEQHPGVYYQQPSDVSTGEYGDNNLDDEFFWAASELFISTGEEKYQQKMNGYNGQFSTPSWSSTATLGLYSLLASDNNRALNAEKKLQLESALKALADSLVVTADAGNAMGVPMASAAEFVWGSNAVAMNQAMLLLNANRIAANQDYLRVAENLLHYILGTNPTGFSFVTGFGTKTPLHIHHRISEADAVVAPIPGMLAGGPQPQQQDNCAGYPSHAMALSYLDDVCSYSSNEIAINWNAPLVYVLAAFNQE